jgi:hypothetical protein
MFPHQYQYFYLMNLNFLNHQMFGSLIILLFPASIDNYFDNFIYINFSQLLN